MKEKTDLRIIKTNKILFDALLKLMKKKNFEKIKIVQPSMHIMRINTNY